MLALVKPYGGGLFMFMKRPEWRRRIAIIVAAIFAIVAWRVLLEKSTVQLKGQRIKQSPNVQLAPSGKWTLLIRGCDTCSAASPDLIAKATEVYAMLLENRSSAQWLDVTQILSNEHKALWEQLDTEIQGPLEEYLYLADPKGHVIAAYPQSTATEIISTDMRHLILID
jgi:hypothetical protein